WDSKPLCRKKSPRRLMSSSKSTASAGSPTYFPYFMNFMRASRDRGSAGRDERKSVTKVSTLPRWGAALLRPYREDGGSIWKRAVHASCIGGAAGGLATLAALAAPVGAAFRRSSRALRCVRCAGGPTGLGVSFRRHRLRLRRLCDR